MRVVRGPSAERAVRRLVGSADARVDWCGSRTPADRARGRAHPSFPVDHRIVVRARSPGRILWSRPARPSHHVGERSASRLLLLGGWTPPSRRANSRLPGQQKPSCFCRALAGRVPDSPIYADSCGAAVDGALADGMWRRHVVDPVRDRRSVDGRLPGCRRRPGRSASRSGASASTCRRHVRRHRCSRRDRSVLLPPHDCGCFRAQPRHERAFRHLACGGAARQAASDRRVGLVYWLAHGDGTFCLSRHPARWDAD